MLVNYYVQYNNVIYKNMMKADITYQQPTNFN